MMKSNSSNAYQTINNIHDIAEGLGEIRLMEVCGTHTMSIARTGIKKVLPDNVSLISGPGCPVCVTTQEQIDAVVGLASVASNVIVTFGDMIKVPGSSMSLEKAREDGADVRIVYSSREAVEIANREADRKVIFISVGFETTTPTIALSVKEAADRKIKNFKILTLNKVIPPAMHAVANESKINGFLCPGHVSAVIGTSPYKVFADDYGIGCVVSGFEGNDILQSVFMLVKQIRDGRPRVENQYEPVVRSEGNITAQNAIYEVFEGCDTGWRGLGIIPSSGLRLNEKYEEFDAFEGIKFDVAAKSNAACKCGEILKGVLAPTECKMFSKKCTPENPIGPCMVSSEGSCAAEYHYGKITA